MRTKIILFISILFLSIPTFSQQNGSIDLITPSKISNGIASRWTIYNMTGDYGNGLQFWAYDNLGCVPGGMCTNRFTIMDNGNVGIGTSLPTGKLDLQSSKSNAGGQAVLNIIGSTWAGNGASLVLNQIWNDNYYKTIIDNHGVNYGQVGSGLKIQTSYWDGSKVNTITSLVLSPNGNLGIGSINPDSKLTVKGKIHAEEVKIDLSIPAPDYVFANDYKLKSLREVEEYIKNNSHLPEIPSAQEIEKNGLMLAEMNMMLLKKMEEMTLYMIEQNRISQELTKKVEILEVALKSNKKLNNQFRTNP